MSGVESSEMREVLPANVAVMSRQRRRQGRECVWVEPLEALKGLEGVSEADVVVLNGRCAATMAMDVRGKVKEGGLLIVRGARLGEETERTYEVVGEWGKEDSMRSRMSPLEMLGKEFNGIVVYRKVHSET